MTHGENGRLRAACGLPLAAGSAVCVILCDPGDDAALWLHDTLRDLGLCRIDLVSVGQLVYSTRIVHQLSDAVERGEIHLSDGRTLRPEAIRGLVNRVNFLPTRHFDNVATADQGYATEELSAFFLAWLDAIPGRVINPPLPFSLNGGDFPIATVMHCAATAGLPTGGWHARAHESEAETSSSIEPTHVVIVFVGILFGPILPRDLQDACRRLAILLGLPLMQVALRRLRTGEWRFMSVTGNADFRLGGSGLAAAIGRELASSPEPA